MKNVALNITARKNAAHGVRGGMRAGERERSAGLSECA